MSASTEGTMDQEEVKEWMEKEILYNRSDYDDCGECDCTLLAENAAQMFDLYEGDDCDIPDWIFELAVEINEETW